MAAVAPRSSTSEADPPASHSLLARLIELAYRGYDPAVARRAGGRARFDHLACRAQGLRDAPRGVGLAGAAALADMDDVHWASVTHPGAIIWAVLDAVGADGERLWRGAHLGYEVTTRLAAALGSEHRRLWHATTTAGTVGAAVAAASAVDADPLIAAAHAVSVSGGSIVCILERTGSRVLHRDHAADTAIRCVHASHLSAALDSLEHPRGMFAAMGGSGDVLLRASEATALEQVSFRRHATCGYNQAAVEAAQELAPQTDPKQVELEVPEATAALAAIAEPQDDDQAWWSCQHAVAATLLGRDLATCAFDDPAVRSIRQRIRVRTAGSTKLIVDGRVAQRDHAAELTDVDLIAKWHSLNPETEPPTELLS